MAASQIINEASLVNNKDGNVNLNIQGNVIIVAGGEGLGSDRYATQGARPKSLKKNDKPMLQMSDIKDNEKIEELLRVINENTKKMTAVRIIDEIGSVRLNEPDFKVFPQMRKVKGYFDGGYEKCQDNEIETKERNLFGRSKKKLMKTQIRREIGFHFKERNEDEPITVEKLVKSLAVQNQSRKATVTAVVASAGSGKTTLLRRIARDCLDGLKTSNSDNESGSQQNHIKMIHFIEMKNVRQQENIKPSQFLFGGLYKNEKEEDKAYEWLQDHQSEAVLFLDGLDQATWSVNKSYNRNIQPFGKANTAEILYNILCRNLLPGVRIVIASREFKISELPADARPKELITLVGLKREDAERLFKSIIGERGDDIWKNIEKISPRLLNLISVPVFLVLAAVVMASDPNNRPPVTITELYNRILLSLRRVENFQERDQIIDVIKKLKAMAHLGMVEGRVVFYESDLKAFGLSAQDVRDLMLKVPGNNLLSRHLFEGDFMFFFCHQSLQEFLSASFVAEMGILKFFRFSIKHLQESRWSVVRTFVSGIVHNESATELHKVSDLNWKRKIFSRVVLSLIQTGKNVMEILATVYESNSDDLTQSLPWIPSLAENKLSQDEAHMLGVILARRGKVKREKCVELMGCGLNDDRITIMVESMKGRKSQVEDINLVRNPCTPEGLNVLLKKMDVEQIRLGYNHLKTNKFEEFVWNNIKGITFKHWESVKNVYLFNDNECLKIDGCVKGHFNKSKAAQDVSKSLSLYHVEDGSIEGTADLAAFFSSFTSIKVMFNTQIFMKPSDLVRLNSSILEGEISKLLLDCRSERNVDSSLIDSCVRKFQVKLLDIIVNGNTSFFPDNFLTSNESPFGTNMKVHWWFKVTDINDIDYVIRTVEKYHVHNIRLHIVRGVTFELISIIIKNAKVENLTLSYESEYTPLRKKHEAIVKLGIRHSIDVRRMTDRVEENAWREADSRYWR